MHAIILVITIFLYSGEVVTVSKVAPSAKECDAVRSDIVAVITERSDVQSAAAVCLKVPRGDKL